MLTTRYKGAFDAALRPLAGWLARRGVSPTALTLTTPVAGAALCWWFVQTRAVVPFALAMTALGLLDGLDGAVARAGGRTSKFGAYLDAMCDRYVDTMVVLAAAWVTGYWALSLLALAGGLLTSYAKARAAMEVPVSNLEWPDFMERTERSVLFMAGLALSALCPWRPLGRDLFWWTLLVLAALTHLTVLQRVLRARQLIRSRG
jgi:phosphatidylglycerophosphate synthase